MKHLAGSMTIAERETITRLVNAYLRETGNHDPRDASRLTSSHQLNETPIRILLPHTKKTILGTVVHWSAGGHHSYGDRFFLETGLGAEPLAFEQLTELLLHEVAAVETEEAAREHKRDDLAQMIQNSLKNMNTYIERARSQGYSLSVPVDYRTSEQSLYFGHPFHPTPKSSEGFSPEDLQRYAPEMGASFPLHYFAISSELIKEDWVHKPDTGEHDAFLPAGITDEAREKLNGNQGSYTIHPCHPWQAKYLLSQPLVKKWAEEQKLIDLGLLGSDVYPTSSVRTVWSPENRCYYKMSLHVRITNFIRENTLEQLQRTLDAARVVNCVKDRYTSDTFSILLENGYRTVSIPSSPDEVNEQMMASFSVILREAPPECDGSENVPGVIASLLEVPPAESEPTLFRAIRNGNHGELPDLCQWLEQYLAISLVPILRIFAETGISLEAHVQNSMLRLENGFPSRFYVRDLEGISVDRDQARLQNWIGSVVSSSSPVLYTGEQAWFRLQYYFFVNHLGHLVQTLARYSQQDESPFWQVVRQTLLRMKTADAPERLTSLVDDLMQKKTLPAKANLLSRFQKRGENPLYVEIPNPIEAVAD